MTAKSETYLKDYVNKHTTMDQLDVYRVMHAAGQVETILGLTGDTKFDKPAGVAV